MHSVPCTSIPFLLRLVRFAPRYRYLDGWCMRIASPGGELFSRAEVTADEDRPWGVLIKVGKDDWKLLPSYLLVQRASVPVAVFLLAWGKRGVDWGIVNVGAFRSATGAHTLRARLKRVETRAAPRMRVPRARLLHPAFCTRMPQVRLEAGLSALRVKLPVFSEEQS